MKWEKHYAEKTQAGSDHFAVPFYFFENSIQISS